MQRRAAKVIFDPKQVYDFELEKTLDEKILLKKLKPALDEGTEENVLEVDVTNIDRTFGTIFGAEITRKYGDNTLEDDTFTRSSVPVPADRALVHLFRKVLTT